SAIQRSAAFASRTPTTPSRRPPSSVPRAMGRVGSSPTEVKPSGVRGSNPSSRITGSSGSSPGWRARKVPATESRCVPACAASARTKPGFSTATKARAPGGKKAAAVERAGALPLQPPHPPSEARPTRISARTAKLRFFTRPPARASHQSARFSSNQDHLRDLGRRAQAHGRPPESGALADVDLGEVAVAMQARHVGLRQRNQHAEGPNLAAVGMPRELQADAQPRRVVDGARLVSQQHQLPLRIAACQSEVVGGTGDAPVAVSAGAVDAGEVEGGGVADGSPLVAEDPDAHAAPLLDPVLHARVIRVVAGDEVDAVAR